MLLLLSIRVAERQYFWETDVYLVYRVCLSLSYTFINFFVYSFQFEFEAGIWDSVLLVPQHYLVLLPHY